VGSPAIFKGSKVKLLKDKIEFFNNQEIQTGESDNPNTTAKDANRCIISARW